MSNGCSSKRTCDHRGYGSALALSTVINLATSATFKEKRKAKKLARELGAFLNFPSEIQAGNLLVSVCPKEGRTF